MQINEKMRKIWLISKLLLDFIKKKLADLLHFPHFIESQNLRVGRSSKALYFAAKYTQSVCILFCCYMCFDFFDFGH